MLFSRQNLVLFGKKCVNFYSRKLLFKQNQRHSIKLFSSPAPGIRPRPYKETKYLEKDQIPNGYKIIYRAPMENYLMATNYVSTLSSCIVAAIMFHKHIKGTDLFHLPIDDSLGGLAMGDNDLVYFAIGFFMLTIAVRLIIKIYPLRIYRYHNSYIAIFEGQIPFRKTRLFFEKGDVSETTSSSLNPWKDEMYKINEKKVILFIDHFKTPSELTEMLK